MTLEDKGVWGTRKADGKGMNPKKRRQQGRSAADAKSRVLLLQLGAPVSKSSTEWRFSRLAMMRQSSPAGEAPSNCHGVLAALLGKRS